MSFNSPISSSSVQRKIKYPSIAKSPKFVKNLKMQKSTSKPTFRPKLKHLRNLSSTQKILPTINSEIELINHLTLDNNPLKNIFNSSIRIIQDKEKIDNNIEVNNKRIGKPFETEKHLSKEQQQDELKSNQSREFFIRYEMMKNEKNMEDEISILKKKSRNNKKRKRRS